jgi:hypothetical protein
MAHVIGHRLREERQHRAQPGIACADRGRQTVMRADTAEGDHATPAARLRRAEQPLELARLVAAVEWS